MIAEVIINRTAKKLNRTFDYNIPQILKDLVTVGSKVLVPFGKGGKLEEAFVTKIKETTNYEYEIKDIAKIENSLSNKQIELAQWMSKKYFCNVSDCINLMLVPGTNSKNKEKRIKYKEINVVNLSNNAELAMLEGKIKSEKQLKIINFLKIQKDVTIPEIEQILQCSRGIVNTLIKNGYVEVSKKIIERNPLENKKIEKNSKLQLTYEQQIAYEKVAKKIDNNLYEKFLLYGITGSGKTEIYLQLIQKILEMKKTAIVLVPEISLTPQMLDRFIGRFGKNQIAVLHSKLSIGERHDEWKKIQSGEVNIVIRCKICNICTTKKYWDNNYRRRT